MDKLVSKAEALKLLQFQFEDESGLIATVEKSGFVDANQVAVVEGAFKSIIAAVEKDKYIQKDDIKNLFVIPRLESAYWKHPHYQKDIARLIDNIYKWTQGIVSPAPSKEYMKALVFTHLMGVPPSFRMELRAKNIDAEAAEELVDALDGLADTMKNDDSIPKSIAVALVGAEHLVWEVGGIYIHEELQELRLIQSNILQHVLHCLS